MAHFRPLLSILVYLLFLVSTLEATPLFFHNTELEMVPISYKGRFRPMGTYAQLWSEEVFHSLPYHQCPLELLWRMHFSGHEPWDEEPLFTVTHTTIKKLAHLDTDESLFSYNQLYKAFFEDKETNFNLLKPLLLYHYGKKYRENSSKKIELSELTPGLWLTEQNGGIRILSLPDGPLWQHLQVDQLIDQVEKGKIGQLEKNYFRIAQEIMTLKNSLSIYSHAANDLYLLPSRSLPGQWLPIQALNRDTVSNFTLYDAHFNAIQKNYMALTKAFQFQNRDPRSEEHLHKLAKEFAVQLYTGYKPLAGVSYKKTAAGEMHYPTYNQLKAELLYTHYPWSITMVGAYITALVLFILAAYSRQIIVKLMALIMLIGAFSLHTFILALRCYILERPPVSNMFETVIYVPWIAVALAFALYLFGKRQSTLPLIAGASVASILLVLLAVTHLDNSLENVQAVLNSQYWLTVHVLMVVASYGAFALAGLLGHYLLIRKIGRSDEAHISPTAHLILQSIYVGVALLTVGTILGGVWAAQSWGRFWDWDPKESWAFISICVYLIIVHAHRFKKINSLGLAIGSIVGLLAISFTWYGVNYILGTGLHSYGFGSGGELYYWSYFFGEVMLLIGFCLYLARNQIRKILLTFSR